MHSLRLGDTSVFPMHLVLVSILSISYAFLTAAVQDQLEESHRCSGSLNDTDCLTQAVSWAASSF